MCTKRLADRKGGSMKEGGVRDEGEKGGGHGEPASEISISLTSACMHTSL